MRCLVTGGAGFIGSHLVERLLADGHDVRVLDDLSTGARANLDGAARCRIELLEGPVTDAGLVRRAVEGAELVFHLAALPSVARSVSDPLATHAACATGALMALDAARLAGARRVVYAASSSAYGGSPSTLRSEATPTSPLSPYAAAKLAGELYCKAFTATYGLETVRLRFFNVFGPRQRADSPYSGVVPLFISALLKGEPPTVHGDGLQTRDFTYVDNAVEALVLAGAAPRAAGKVYNVGAGGSMSVLGLLACLQRLLGTSLEPRFAPARAGDVRHSHADISLARAELGYAPSVSAEEGLRLTAETLGATIRHARGKAGGASGA